MEEVIVEDIKIVGLTFAELFLNASENTNFEEIPDESEKEKYEKFCKLSKNRNFKYFKKIVDEEKNKGWGFIKAVTSDENEMFYEVFPVSWAMVLIFKKTNLN